jgi:hypothetical protein
MDRLLRFSTKRFLIGTSLVVVLLVMGVSAASADAPPGPYFNGFETNTAGWFNYSGATITRVPSGDMSTAYASGVAAATGNYYARLGIDPSPASCTFGGGTAPIYYGPYTDWGGDTTAVFPPGGYSTGADIYLDVPYAQSHLDTRFDWDSAINDTTGNFRRDFVFNVGTDALGFVITGGNNATRCGANPADPGHFPVHILTSGWYTFKHTFSGVPGGVLTVTLTVAPAGTNTPLGTWARSDPSDIIGTTVGGNAYGWFVQNEFDGLAIDNTFRTGQESTPGKVTGGGQIAGDPVFSATGTLLSAPALMASPSSPTSQATFGFSVTCCAPSGNLEYNDHSADVRIKAQSIDGLFISSPGTSCPATPGSQHARFTGMASVIRSAATTMESFTVEVDDCGEPGTTDTFGITTTTYSNGPSMLIGGNIQIHQ